MYKLSRNIYTIKTCPYNDNERLENLLNDMSRDGWEVYSIQELESDDDILYNCIFIKEIENDDLTSNENDDLLNFKSKIERIINPELDPYELCVDIQKKIKETRQKIAQVKSLIDGTSEDSRTVLNEEISKHINELDSLKKQLSKVINPDIMEQKLGEKRITLTLSEELIYILDNDNEYNILSQIVYIRQNLTEKLGYIIPKIKIEADDSLEENEFSIKIRGIPVIKSRAYLNRTMFSENEPGTENNDDDFIYDTDVITGNKTVWINEEKAKDYWAKGYDATDYIAHVIEFIVMKHIDEIFDYSDINRYIEIVGNCNLYLVENIIPDYMSIAELKYILTSLIKEGVSIKDIVYVFEQINDFSDETDKEQLLSRLRTALSRQISDSAASDDNMISVFEISDETADLFRGTDGDDNVVRIDGSRIEELLDKIKDIADQKGIELRDVVLLAPSDVRHVIYLVLSRSVSYIKVIAREEIAAEYNLETVAVI